MAAETVADAVLNHTAKPYSFSFSPFLRDTYQVGLPADRPICKAYQTGSCPNGTRCTERHVAASASASGGSSNTAGAADGSGRPAYSTGGGLNSLVCKHWLRGLCKKGVPCEFLHEYNLRRMPECNFFMRNGYCSNGDECLYLHVDPLSRLPPCPHYDNVGFCPLGPVCARKHVRRRLCPFYLAGFCPDGPACRRGSHPKWSAQLERPTPRQQQPQTQTQTHESDDDDNSKSRADSVAAALLQQQQQGQQGQQMQTNFDDGLKDDRFGGRHGGRGGGGKWRGGGAGPGGGGGGRGRFRGRGGY